MVFVAQRFDSHSHQVHGAERVMKTGMQRAGIYQVRHAQLLNVPQPLKIGMFNKIEYQLRRDTDKAVNRIVNYFLFVQYGYKNVK